MRTRRPQIVIRLALILILGACVLAASAAPTHAQGTLTGRVTDEEGTSVASANIQLLAATDSSLVQGTVGNEEGPFILEAIDEGANVRYVSLIGYSDYTSEWSWREGEAGDPPRVETAIDAIHGTVQLTYSLRFGDGKAGAVGGRPRARAIADSWREQSGIGSGQGRNERNG